MLMLPSGWAVDSRQLRQLCGISSNGMKWQRPLFDLRLRNCLVLSHVILIGMESEAETGLGLCRIHNGARASASRLDHYGAILRPAVDANVP
jgi:hypothetical protein